MLLKMTGFLVREASTPRVFAVILQRPPQAHATSRPLVRIRLHLLCKSLVESAAYAPDYHYGPQFVFGTVLFLCGMLTNTRCDNILLNLRQPGDSSYKIPRGGLFELVSGANYTGEIMEWLGFTVAAGTLPAAAFAAYTFSNIAPRAHKHHLWYLEKFEDYPKGRKAVIPGVW